jgi:ankyrin repeat protein
LLSLLLRSGAASRALVNKRDAGGLAALHWCVLARHPEHARLLLATGLADASVGDDEGRTPLHYAVSAGDAVACVPALLAAPPPAAGGHIVNARDQAGRTPLHLACGEGDAAAVAALLACPAIEVDATDARGTTPLHWAVVCNQPALCGTLLQAGASGAVRDMHGLTPLHYATEKRFHECVNTLQRYRASTRPVTAHPGGATLLQPAQLLGRKNSGSGGGGAGGGDAGGGGRATSARRSFFSRLTGKADAP